MKMSYHEINNSVALMHAYWQASVFSRRCCGQCTSGTVSCWL